MLTALRLHSTLGGFGGFGGLSGAQLDEDGVSLTVVSDRGRFFELEFLRNAKGNISGLRQTRGGDLVGIDGKPLAGRDADAEDLARVADGGFFVSFERFHRLRFYRHGLDRPPEAVAIPDEARDLPANEGIESVAMLPDGQLFLMTEALDEKGAATVWLGGPGHWARSFYVPRMPFRPTGAAALPDGSILVLERHFSLFGGFSSILVRASPPRQKSGGWRRTELLSLDRAPLAENFEAVTTWRDPSGALRAYLVADDNFNPFQTSLILEILLN